MARQKGGNGKFGAFFDSVIDRYSELFLYGGLMVYYASHGDVTGSLLVYFAMMGSIMVSYTRARAESLGFSAKIGLLSRVERYIILVPSLIFRWLYIGLGILAVFTNFTAIQRILSVNKQASEAVSPDKP